MSQTCHFRTHAPEVQSPAIVLRAVCFLGMGWLLGIGWPPCTGVLQRTNVPREETVLYRHIVFLSSIAITVLGVASAALAADSERCQELDRRFRTAKPQITAIEVSL